MSYGFDDFHTGSRISDGCVRTVCFDNLLYCKYRILSTSNEAFSLTYRKAPLMWGVHRDPLQERNGDSSTFKKELPFAAFTGKKRAPISLARNRCSHLFYRELLWTRLPYGQCAHVVGVYACIRGCQKTTLIEIPFFGRSNSHPATKPRATEFTPNSFKTIDTFIPLPPT
mgnify:CR=1 FL=1